MAGVFDGSGGAELADVVVEEHLDHGRGLVAEVGACAGEVRLSDVRVRIVGAGGPQVRERVAEEVPALSAEPVGERHLYLPSAVDDVRLYPGGGIVSGVVEPPSDGKIEFVVERPRRTSADVADDRFEVLG